MPTYETSSRLELRDRAATLNDKYAGRPAGDVVSAVLRDEFQGKVALVSSFGTDGRRDQGGRSERRSAPTQQRSLLPRSEDFAALPCA